MSRLNNKLNLWEQHQLIAPEQKQLILDFENSHKKPHLLYAVLILGVFVTALGIISLIAANWDAISDVIKLTVDFLLLIALAAYIYFAAKHKKTFHKEAGLFALFLMTGASIGLISQIFQTNGTFENAAIMWGLFTASLLFVSDKKLLPLFWVPLMVYGLCFRHEFFEAIEDIIAFIRSHISEEPAVCGAIFILFFSGLTYAFNYLNHSLGGKYPIFAVLRGYSEFGIYSFAVIGLFFGRSISIPSICVSIVTFAAATWVYYRQNASRMLNFNIAMIGVCFFIAYVRIFKDLLTTGIGLIISGIIIIALVWGLKTIMARTSALKGE